uniref:Major facilitator superfamily (MFS) profile domain-containing protein n=1 Tax=Caenorhabditis japonica TaxID=281687 RepID=A0A8R1HKN5_CAEJA
MATRRRPSMRTRMKAEDVSCWVEHNQPNFSPHDEHHVRFEPLPQTARDDSDSESEESLTERPVYMDGGYAWFVTLCSFIMHAVCDGSSFCFGILFVMIQIYYKADRIVSMIAASLFLSLPLCLSPVAGITSDILGCRYSILVGATICTVSCFMSIFASNIWYFTLFFGFGCGAGMSFIYNAAIVIVTYYFDKKRGMATSIAVAGTGCGTFLFPLYIAGATSLLSVIASELQATLIAFTLAYFLIVIIGFFIKDVEWESDKTEYKLRQFERNVKAIMEAQESAASKTISRHACSLPDLNITQAIKTGSKQSLCEVGTDGKTEMPTRSKSVAHFNNKNPVMQTIPEYTMIRLANLEHLDLELANSPCTTVKATRRRIPSKVSMSVDQINELEDEDFKINLFVYSSESSSGSKTMSSSELSNDGDSSSSELSEKPTEPLKLINKNLAVGALANRATSSAPNSARVFRNSLAPGNANISGGRIMASNAIQNRYVTNLLTMGKIPSAPMLIARKKRRNILIKLNLAILKRMTENEIPVYKTALKSKSYQYLIASVLCLYLILDVPYVCFYDYALDHLQLSEKWAGAIYSAIGGANFLSTIVYGKFADLDPDRKYVHMIYAGSMVGVAVSMVLAVFATAAWNLIIIGAMFGVFVTSNYVLQSIMITVCFEDMNVFQGAYSMIGLIEGLASLIGPPIFATIRELTGSYTLVFLIASFFALLSAIFLVLLHHAEQQLEADEENSVQNEEAGLKQIDGKFNAEKNGTGAEHQNLLV